MHRLGKFFTLALILVSVAAIPANARVRTTDGPLTGDYELKITAVYHPQDGSEPVKQVSVQVVTVSDDWNGNPSQVTMTGFPIVTGTSTTPYFVNSSGWRVNDGLVLRDEWNYGSLRLNFKENFGVATTFTARGTLTFGASFLDLKIKGTRTGL